MERKGLRFIVATALLTAVGGCGQDPGCPDDSEPSGPMAPPGNGPFLGGGDPYAPGSLAVRRIELDACSHGNPRPVLIFAPQPPGSYPVVAFQHGFLGRNTDYSEILRHLASHGFVAVAPQMYEPGVPALLGQPSVVAEAQSAVLVLDWLGGGLAAALGYAPDTSRIGLVGHSRGGEVVWLVLTEDPGRALAVAGVDPVDGGGPLHNQVRVVQGQFGFSLPALVIGAGLAGGCALAGENHEQFYAASRPPAWHVVVPRAGHGDMLDEEPARLAGLICGSGVDREGMRRLTAGLLVAFFRASLQGDEEAYAYLSDQRTAPREIQVERR